MKNQLKQENKQRKWKTYENLWIEESLFNEIIRHTQGIPENVKMAAMPDEVFENLYKMFYNTYRQHIAPALRRTHDHGYKVAMQEQHLVEPVTMTIHWLSDGKAVYVSRKEMLPYK